jgi:hypothetical protein
MSQTAPAQARTGFRRHRGILALLAALACLAGLAIAELKIWPSRPVAPRIAGLKTGSTQAAGGCVLIAALAQGGRAQHPDRGREPVRQRTQAPPSPPRGTKSSVREQ